jgi:hypothetical protein
MSLLTRDNSWFTSLSWRATSKFLNRTLRNWRVNIRRRFLSWRSWLEISLLFQRTRSTPDSIPCLRFTLNCLRKSILGTWEKSCSKSSWSTRDLLLQASLNTWSKTQRLCMLRRQADWLNMRTILLRQWRHSKWETHPILSSDSCLATLQTSCTFLSTSLDSAFTQFALKMVF